MNYNLKFLLILPLTLILTNCTEIELASHAIKKVVNNTQSQGTFKVGNPYKIFDKWYTPQEDYNLIETGIASWYGPNFHGKLTANGEVFNQNDLTAAHRTLQIPSIVRVTNLENGRSIIVRINDRGPFKRGRIIDLSKRAAEILDFKNQGTAKVRIQVLEKESRAVAEVAKRGESTRGTEIILNKKGELPSQHPTQVTLEPIQEISPIIDNASLKPAERIDLPFSDMNVKNIPVPDTQIYVQVASFASPDNATDFVKKLSHVGESNINITKSIVNGQEMPRVRLGPLNNVANADRLLARLSDKGYNNGIIIVE